MTEERYIPVAEFAKLAGISRQTVYSKLDKMDCQEVDKIIRIEKTGKQDRKLISTNALQLFSKKEPCKTDCKSDCKSDSQEDKIIDSVLDSLTAQLQSKDQQLQARDKTIEDLTRQIEQLQSQNSTLSNSLIDQGKELTRLLDQQQQLQAMYARQLTLTAPKEEPEQIQDKEDHEEQPEKQGFWKRLFRW